MSQNPEHFVIYMRNQGLKPKSKPINRDAEMADKIKSAKQELKKNSLSDSVATQDSVIFHEAPLIKSNISQSIFDDLSFENKLNKIENSFPTIELDDTDFDESDITTSGGDEIFVGPSLVVGSLARKINVDSEKIQTLSKKTRNIF